MRKVDCRFAIPGKNETLTLIPHLTIEVGKHNIEFNPPPMPVARAAGIAATLADALRRASARAQTFNAAVISVGLLPTLTPADFTVAMMTDSERVALLLARLRELKGGGDNVFAVNIGAGEGLYIAVNSAVLESATTSFQIHLQVPVQNAANYYNAAQLIAAPLISASANSPFFMGRRLWEETRVPVFEQILYERFTHEGGKRKRRDDFFGAQYLNHSLTEIYEQNLRLPVLLPVLSEDGAHLPHLSLHNSTVWRWNRPVLGFDDNGAPTLRIEHRGLPAGPTAADMAADAALFIGAVCALSKNLNLADAPPFAKTRDNFYAAARDGLRADLHWFNGKVINAAELITKNILPLAKKGLQTLGAEEDEINTIAEVILRRAESGQNGAQSARLRFLDNAHTAPINNAASAAISAAVGPAGKPRCSIRKVGAPLSSKPSTGRFQRQTVLLCKDKCGKCAPSSDNTGNKTGRRKFCSYISVSE